ncbi:MAG: hypothetical protein M0R17_02040 [Candidatus Omnitrophica bacterium]|jgi:hypothetical protein|nr:hypothetical protein [Candidatus Omnitrophota bacterium]
MKLKYLLCKLFGHKPKTYDAEFRYWVGGKKKIEMVTRKVIWCERCGAPEIDIIMDKMR